MGFLAPHDMIDNIRSNDNPVDVNDTSDVSVSTLSTGQTVAMITIPVKQQWKLLGYS